MQCRVIFRGGAEGCVLFSPRPLLSEALVMHGLASRSVVVCSN